MSATWCDGTPHSPKAIPPLPFHDWRYDCDNPWLICARCRAMSTDDDTEPTTCPTCGGESMLRGRCVLPWCVDGPELPQDGPAASSEGEGLKAGVQARKSAQSDEGKR